VLLRNAERHHQFVCGKPLDHPTRTASGGPPWGHRLAHDWRDTKETSAQARQLFAKAVALDPQYAEAYVALAPPEAGSYAALAEMLSDMGRTEEALQAATQALHLKTVGVADGYLPSVGTAYYLVGRPEAAIAPLKQFLSHYPNFLGAHLTLAAVYSELGREAEARAAVAEVLRINPQFSLEVHRQRVPIKDPAVLERHLAALRKAGLK
jgi:tetratricopeptide (TPR) repeat protein